MYYFSFSWDWCSQGKLVVIRVKIPVRIMRCVTSSTTLLLVHVLQVRLLLSFLLPFPLSFLFPPFFEYVWVTYELMQWCVLVHLVCLPAGYLFILYWMTFIMDISYKVVQTNACCSCSKSICYHLIPLSVVLASFNVKNNYKINQKVRAVWWILLQSL